MRGPDAPPIGRADLPSPVPVHPLDRLLTPQRARKYRQVLARRTGRLAVVVEDCFDPHNATAIIRTCDAFGIHRVVVTTGRNTFRVNRKVSQGSHHYVELQVFPEITAAYAALREQGFVIYVSDLAADAVVGPERLLPLLAERPLALVFGNEGSGVSVAASAGADGHFIVPMVGFPQSLNLSVAVASTLYGLRADALSRDLPGDLDDATQCAVYDRWVHAHKGAVADAVLRHEAERQAAEGQAAELDEYAG